jgi:hypothetical protein
MSNEPTNKNLMSALLEVQRALPSAQSNKSNPHLKNKYADLSAVQAVCRPLLLEHGLVVSHTTRGEANGGITIVANLTHAATGETITSEITMTPAKNTPQEVGSCLTYGRRYTLAALVGIVVDDDDDANAASRPPKPKTDLESLKADVRKAIKGYTGDDKEQLIGECQIAQETGNFDSKFANDILGRILGAKNVR